MNKHLLSSTLAAILAVSLSVSLRAQSPVSGTVINVSANSSNSIGNLSSGSAVGKQVVVSSNLSNAFGEKISVGPYATGSFVAGNNDTVTLSQSVCLGAHNRVSSMGGVAIGRYLNAGGSSNTFVMGEGVDAGNKLVSTGDHCLAIGFNSTRPTLTVTRSPNSAGSGVLDRTGKVAIGDVASPQAKLHIRSDDGEDAGIFLQPANPAESDTYIRLRDNAHRIAVDGKGCMSVVAGNANALEVVSSNMKLSGSLMTLGGTDNGPLYLFSGGTPSLTINALPSSNGYLRNATAPSYAVEFGANGLTLRTATYMIPRYDFITNWRDALSVKTNGAITLNGRVGVNTENTTSNFALAVNGGIIATEMYVMEVENWPDYVFDINYKLMPLNELKRFVNQNHHLPETPSKREASENGCNLGEMQKLLLKKIEELTLYIIQQDERISQLEKELNINR